MKTLRKTSGLLILIMALLIPTTAQAADNRGNQNQQGVQPKATTQQVAPVKKQVPQEVKKDPFVDKLIKLDQKFDEKTMEMITKKEEQDAKRDAYRIKMTEIISTYDAQQLVAFENAWSIHDGLHVSLLEVRSQIVSESAIAFKGVIEDVKKQLEAKTITKEQAIQVIKGYRTQLQLDREAKRVAIDALEAQYNFDKDAVRLLNVQLVKAVEAKDTTAVPGLLEAILVALNEHLVFDQAKLDYLRSEK